MHVQYLHIRSKLKVEYLQNKLYTAGTIPENKGYAAGTPKTLQFHIQKCITFNMEGWVRIPRHSD